MARPSRRALVVAAVPLAGFSAGCSVLGNAGGDSTPTPPPEPEPDELLRTQVLAAERDLIHRYSATAAAHPPLADLLIRFQRRHEAHLRALTEHGAAPTAARSPSNSPGEPQQTVDPTGAGPRARGATPDASSSPKVPAEPAAAVAALQGAERVAARQRINDCVAAEDRELARLLAAMAACEAAHDHLLGVTA